MSFTIYAISKRDANQTLIGSVDNGATWSVLQTPFLNADVNAIQTTPGYTNRVIVASSSGFYYSLDSGLSWNPSGGSFYATPTNPVLQLVNNLVAWGGDEYLCRSTDGGLTFNDVNDANTISGGLSSNMQDLYFLDEYAGVVAIGELLYYTNDAGSTFTPLNSNNPIDSGADIISVVTDSTGTLILATTANGIFQSTDAGASFTNVVAFIVNSYRLFKINDSTYYAYGQGIGTSSIGILKTINGGSTWNLQSADPVLSFGADYGPLGKGVDMLWFSESDGFWISRTGSIIKTTTEALSGTTVYTATPTTQNYRLAGGPTLCGECPDGYTFNESTGFCEQLINSLACPPGFIFNPATGNCEKGLDSTPPYCDPEECFITTVGGVSYCNCVSQIPLYACCYILTNCFDPEDQIYTQTDLSQYDGQVLQLSEYPGLCYFFAITDNFCESAEAVTVVATFENCDLCRPSYKLYLCGGSEEDVHYTEDDLSAYVQPSMVVTIEEYPDLCWQVGINSDPEYTPETITVVESYETCDTCLTKYFVLTNCNDEEDIIYAEYSDDLNANNGLVIRIGNAEAFNCYEVLLVQEYYTGPPLVPVNIYQGGFEDCECCIPPLPVEPPKYVQYKPNPHKEFYYITSSKCDIKTMQRFSDGYYRMYLGLAYGIKNCCGNVDYDKLWIKYNLSEYASIYDETACVAPVLQEEPECVYPTPTNTCITPGVDNAEGNF